MSDCAVRVCRARGLGLVKAEVVRELAAHDELLDVVRASARRRAHFQRRALRCDLKEQRFE